MFGVLPLALGIGAGAEIQRPLAVAVLVVVGISFLVPERKKAPTTAGGVGGPAGNTDVPLGEFDPYAGGYPVPPMPGQHLPPSPRRARAVDAVPAGAARQVTDSQTEAERG